MDQKAIVIATCLKRAEIKMAASGVRATGKELLFVEEEDGSCTVFGTDEAGNAVDIRDDATLTMTSADAAYVTAETPHGLPKDAKNMTFRLRGVEPTVDPVVVSVNLAPAKDSLFKSVGVDLPCVVTKTATVPRSIAPPTIVVTPGMPVIHGSAVAKAKAKPAAVPPPHA